ncbi:hypothetical protein EFP84_18740 [Leptospira kmetyi]|uniref:Uncharacterized protein n=1 Tax=Leptospira kmetyi TaxID=408139 RepID=A0AAD0XSC1_9LEPT|nr:hypothetical protein [Leptospira kmetyi]AYV57683.1 hypothetical protein EFP84_18740 [Leptospira kmetyi]
MATYSEIEAIKAIDEALSKITEESTRKRIVSWTIEKYGEGLSQRSANSPPVDKELSKKSARRKKGLTKITKTSKAGSRTKQTLSIDKTLNLKPSKKESLKDFVSKKKPNTNQEKCTVIVYYLSRVIELSNVGATQVFTCYKHMNWRVPSDMRNVLALTASRKGWLDTSDTDNIQLTTHGENLVEHDLPANEK